MRRFQGFLLGLAAVLLIGATTGVTLDHIHDMLHFNGFEDPPGSTTTTQAPTTTVAPTTTPSPTTTQAPTTTVAPTTTALGIPATVPHPNIGDNCSGSCVNSNGYQIETKNGTTGVNWWNAPYLYPAGIQRGPGLPYQVEAGWIEGDRIGYNCAYGFLWIDFNGNGVVDDGELTHRFGFFRIPGISYSFINDRFMPEGNYYFDGSETPFADGPEGQAYRVNFCSPQVSQTYEAYTGPDENPKIPMRHNGLVAEIRDYAFVNRLSPDLKFRLLPSINTPFTVTETEGNKNPDGAALTTHTVFERETVLAYENNLPVIVVYYDALVEGATVESIMP